MKKGFRSKRVLIFQKDILHRGLDLKLELTNIYIYITDYIYTRASNITEKYFTFMWPCIVTNFFLIKPTDALISQIYFCQENLCVSGSSCAHHQEFSTVHSALVYVIKLAWHIPVPNIQWKTPDDGQSNCPKHVDFLDKNKFGKLVRLLVLLKKKWQKTHKELSKKQAIIAV